jgi:succinate-semialdehyde dehydrogenase/glutarate-semialdehyde dehydrogenase
MTSAETATSHPALQDKVLIGGAWRGASDGRVIEVRDPATDELIARVPRLGATDATEAVDAAANAFPAWRATPGAERSKVLRRFYDLIVRNERWLARLMTLEQGKPVLEARARLPMRPGSSNGVRRRRSESTGRPFPLPLPTSESSSCANLSV